jgi:hypothetical protein
VAFRCVLSLESFVCTLRYPTTVSSMELYAAGCRRTNCFPTHYPVRCLVVTALRKRNRYYRSIRSICIRIGQRPSIVIGCRCSCAIELYSSPESYKLKRHIGVENVKHNSYGKDCGFLGLRAERKKRLLPRLNFFLLCDAINLRGPLTFWVRICNNKLYNFSISFVCVYTT